MSKKIETHLYSVFFNATKGRRLVMDNVTSEELLKTGSIYFPVKTMNKLINHKDKKYNTLINKWYIITKQIKDEIPTSR
ncbi:hypothetical protein LY11_03174 [Pedobacter cryoconitis]|uniref:Uncharacterized protein n=1 Tax=Pedobacter cryoconitis TaxID=188932 RepID=A0A327SIE9_9SPHI|nr:hypothetical protein LY11_03174 [Pedobacter cryoconitis]